MQSNLVSNIIRTVMSMENLFSEKIISKIKKRNKRGIIEYKENLDLHLSFFFLFHFSVIFFYPASPPLPKGNLGHSLVLIYKGLLFIKLVLCRCFFFFRLLKSKKFSLLILDAENSVFV